MRRKYGTNSFAVWRRVVRSILRPFYPRVRPGDHCTGGWLDLGAGLDGWGRSLSTHRVDRPVRSELSYQLSCRDRHTRFFTPSNCLLNRTNFVRRCETRNSNVNRRFKHNGWGHSRVLLGDVIVTGVTAVVKCLCCRIRMENNRG
jgi:hypothetical protein